MKRYYLEELYLMNGGRYWRTIIESKDIRQLRKLKKAYEEKNKMGIYRIMEIK